MTKKKLIIVAPYRDEDSLIERMSSSLEAEVELLIYNSNLSISRGVWRRHFLILIMAYRSFIKGRDKDFIFFGEQFLGLYYALFCRIFFWVRQPAKSIVIQIIFNNKSGFFGKAYRGVYGWLASTRSLNFLICHSSIERKYYQKEFGEKIGKKIFFVPFGRSGASKTIKPSKTDEKYFFSGGTSNRDYKTLVEAFSGLEEKLVIACHPNDIKGLKIPKNVVVRHDVFGTLFQSYIENACAVILPILKTDVSAGQLVLIDAMRAGRASIVTSGSCMEDYVDSSCSILIPKQNISALRDAVRLVLSKSNICEILGQSARQRYEQKYTRAAFAERLCNVLLLGPQ